MNIWKIYNSSILISLLLSYMAQCFLPKHEQRIIRDVLSKENSPEYLKQQAMRVVSYHYIPLALSESKKFVNYYKIPISQHSEFNSIAVQGLMKGVTKYNWTMENSNIHVYLKKYILGEMYRNVRIYDILYDSHKLEWQIDKNQYKQKINIDDWTSPLPIDCSMEYRKEETYSDKIYNTIIRNTKHLTPYERRFFFLVYNRYTLRRTNYSVKQICQLLGLENEETYRSILRMIVDELKKQIQKEKETRDYV